MNEEELAAQWEQQINAENKNDNKNVQSENIQKEKEENDKEKNDKEKDDTQKADFQQLKAVNNNTESRNLDFLLEVPLQVSVHVGSTRMLIKDLLQLGQGSIIELNKLAGEPMDVYVNDRLIARGEVVVVNDKFGIRLTDIISPKERVEQLS